MPVRKKKVVEPTPEIEPIYEYKKGVGWVLTLNAWASKVIEGLKITLVERKPEIGEYYFTGRKSAETLLEEFEMDGYWREGLRACKDPEERNFYFNKFSKSDKSYYRRSKTRFMVMTIESHGPE